MTSYFRRENLNKSRPVLFKTCLSDVKLIGLVVRKRWEEIVKRVGLRTLSVVACLSVTTCTCVATYQPGEVNTFDYDICTQQSNSAKRSIAIKLAVTDPSSDREHVRDLGLQPIHCFSDLNELSLLLSCLHTRQRYIFCCL